LRVFINPEIVEEKGEVVFEEGCLSIPNLFLKIKRAKEITVKALNEEGKEFILKADGLLAICLQQEIDHLNGILIIDRIPLIKRLKLMFFKKI
jgi:peptide deformylase